MILVLKNVIGIHFQHGHDFVKNCNAGFVDALLITGNSIFCAADHLSQLSLCISSGFTRFPDAVVIWHGIHHSYLDIIPVEMSRNKKKVRIHELLCKKSVDNIMKQEYTKDVVHKS